MGSGAPVYEVVSIDDDPDVQEALARLLRLHGCQVSPFSDPHAGIAHLVDMEGAVDLVILDVSMPGMGGLEVLSRIQQVAPELPVIMLTGDASAQTAVQALKAGALNYLVKPLRDPEAAAHIVRNAASYGRMQRQLRALETQASHAKRYEKLIGASAPMRELFATIDKIAGLDVNVLILGESGTGKELVARAIHDNSARKHGPFVALNCAALPETLVDAELFGHLRGAFTGAVDSRSGAFERADTGTLFLDEIGDISPAVQIRLLRVLQEREVTRLGGDRPRAIDVRVIAATLVDLEAAVEAGDFRADLFYRLNVVSVPLPPLRHRPDDIGLLAAHFLDKHGSRLNRPSLRLAPEVVAALTGYHWPGNVRELENVIQRAIALAGPSAGGETVIGPGELPDRVAERLTPAAPLVPARPEDDLSWTDGLPFSEARKLLQERFERAYLARLMRETGGNISEAARRSGVDRSNLRRLLGRYGLTATSDD